MKNKTRQLTLIALLASLITISGIAKIPGLLPGTEFQLSAPLAVAICAVFGFTNYILAGLLSSLLSLALGLQNIVNVSIAMLFRLTVGAIFLVFGTKKLVVIIAGPIGSTLARLAMSVLLEKAAIALLIAALPGMLYTALAAWPLTQLLQRVKKQTEEVFCNAVQR